MGALAASLSLLAWVLAGQSPAAASSRIDTAAWLQGCWVMTSGNRTVEENWMPPRAGTMIGVGRTTAGGRLVEYEFVVLKEDGDVLAYEAHPAGQPSATFKSVTLSPTEVVFENTARDFPQRVGYRRDGDALNAWIEGTMNGKPRRVEFPYRRTACPGA